MKLIISIEKSFNKIPIFLRWALFIPAAMIVSATIQTTINTVNKLFTSGLPNPISNILQILKSIFVGYCFLWTAMLMAPKNKIKVGIVLIIFFAFMIAGFFIVIHFRNLYRNSMLKDFLLMALSVGSAIAACIQLNILTKNTKIIQ